MCSDTIDYPVIIYDRPNAAFEVYDAYENVPGVLYLVNQSEGASTYYWDFGNGDTSEEENPIAEEMINEELKATKLRLQKVIDNIR